MNIDHIFPFRNLANMGKSKSLDTEDPPSSPVNTRLMEPVTSMVKDCHQHAVSDSCDNCTDNDKARDLELNKVRRER